MPLCSCVRKSCREFTACRNRTKWIRISPVTLAAVARRACPRRGEDAGAVASTGADDRCPGGPGSVLLLALFGVAGVRMTEPPITPEGVLKALADKRAEG
jgi:hypothetical protein